MPHDSIDLATLIGSRICHDLISPIGAIDNGLELLTMSGGSKSPELSLIGESVGNASARIRFFRIAFGAAGDQMVGQAEIASILRDMYQASRLTLEWMPQEPQPRAAVRLAFLSILCLETAMPYGGRLVIAEEDGDWRLSGSADKLIVNPDLWGHLASEGTAPKLQPSQVQFALVPVHATEDGRKVRSSATETEIEISF